ncbi:MAG: hypothetical protein RLZZ210_82 [Pseudomonadota bacterium]|jgi:hypothetical protein
MLKWFSANSKNNKTDAVNANTAIEQEDLQKARYRLVGAGVLFLSVLLSLPFLVKSQSYASKTLNMRLINEQGNEDDSSTSKTFKKVPIKEMNDVEDGGNNSPSHKHNSNSKKGNGHVENSTSINNKINTYI